MTTENNKIIAEFVQPSFNSFGTYDFNGRFYGGLELKFHSDWNWLMEVVEKIKSIPNKEKFGMLKYEVDIILEVPNVRIVEGYKIMLGSKESKYFDVVHYEGTFIENVYNACVEFIKWYNEQKKE